MKTPELWLNRLLSAHDRYTAHKHAVLKKLLVEHEQLKRQDPFTTTLCVHHLDGYFSQLPAHMPPTLCRGYQNHYFALRSIYTLSHFHISSVENRELNHLKKACFRYMLMTSNTVSEHVQCGSFVTFLSSIFPVVVSPSKY